MEIYKIYQLIISLNLNLNMKHKYHSNLFLKKV